MSFDFNDAEVQKDFSELIPAGTICLLQINIKPGGFGNDGLLERNRDGDCMMLSCEFTVRGGPYNNRKVWQRYVVEGRTDGQKTAVQISRAFLRGVLESARGIRPADTSAEAVAGRRTEYGFADFQDMIFCAKIGTERGGLMPGEGPGGERYDDKNKIAAAVTCDDKRYISPKEAGLTQRQATPPLNSSGAATGSESRLSGGENKGSAPKRPGWAS